MVGGDNMSQVKQQITEPLSSRNNQLSKDDVTENMLSVDSASRDSKVIKSQNIIFQGLEEEQKERLKTKRNVKRRNQIHIFSSKSLDKPTEQNEDFSQKVLRSDIEITKKMDILD